VGQSVPDKFFFSAFIASFFFPASEAGPYLFRVFAWGPGDCQTLFYGAAIFEVLPIVSFDPACFHCDFFASFFKIFFPPSFPAFFPFLTVLAPLPKSPSLSFARILLETFKKDSRSKGGSDEIRPVSGIFFALKGQYVPRGVPIALLPWEKIRADPSLPSSSGKLQPFGVYAAEFPTSLPY